MFLNPISFNLIIFRNKTVWILEPCREFLTNVGSDLDASPLLKGHNLRGYYGGFCTVPGAKVGTTIYYPTGIRYHTAKLWVLQILSAPGGNVAEREAFVSMSLRYLNPD